MARSQMEFMRQVFDGIEGRSTRDLQALLDLLKRFGLEPIIEQMEGGGTMVRLDEDGPRMFGPPGYRVTYEFDIHDRFTACGVM